MLEQPIDPNAYPLGLSWRVPGEVAAQSELRLALLRSLSGLDPEVNADAEVLGRLRVWVRTLPVTGRVPVAVSDARWLQANPSRDPMLQLGDSVVLHRRPNTVTVVTARGTRCAVMHSPGAEAMAYVEICGPADSGQTDWAWVAQPDGRVQRFGVAAWNREAQDEPAPGAWIWAPPRDGGYPEHFSQTLITFLATQGPAPDPGADVLISPADESVNVQRSVRGGVSEAWAPSGLPDLGESAQGLSGRKSPAEFGAAESGSALVLPPPAPSARSHSLVTTASDWGGVGLLQTPSARMEKAGNLAVNFSRIYPYVQGNIMVQPLDWLEAGFRYTNISNRLYSANPEFSGDQALKDKSFDAKFRLWTESAYVPQVALGFRDFAGTGLFSGEYLVANKRTGPLDWSLGLGWGYAGARGDRRNPLSLISSKFDTRTQGTGQGGNFAFGSYFHGPTALFGGVQYQTPWKPLILKLEYDGNDYQHEPQANNQRQGSPWNFGAVYRAGRAVDVTLGVERGNTAMLGVTFHTQLDGLSVPKLNDPPRVPVVLSRPQQAPDWAATSRDIAVQTDWHVRRIEQRGRELRVTLDDADAIYWRDRDDRAAAVLNRDAPANVDRFVLAYRRGGADVAEHLIDRDAWVAQQIRPLPPREQRIALIPRAPETLPPQGALYQDTLPRFETSLGPSYQQTLGGPDAFLLFQLGAAGKAKLRLSEDTWLQGGLQLGLYGNYDKFQNRGSSDLPRVRTYLREYLTTSKLTLPNLQLTHTGSLGGNQYYSMYAGYLESSFAGVGGEWLYRPFASRVAFGVDANYVQQRSFEQDFSFDNAGTQTGYRVATGHATLYWDTGWNDVLAKLSAGRYLAKDMGVTVDLSRVFDNGVKFGAFFTKTNVSAAKFGEGSFDKGVYLSVPFDAFLTRSSNTSANVLWKPLTRDGGAKLYRSVELYDLTRARDDRTLRYKAAPPRNEDSIPEDRRESWTPPPKGPEPYTRVVPQPTAGEWAADAQGYELRLTEALYRQEFRNISVTYDASRRLTVALANDKLHPASRAVGRAARTALHLGPLDMREIRIAFAQGASQVVTYDFVDLTRLQRYFDGEINAEHLADSVAVDYVDPSAREADPLARLDDLDTKAEEPHLADLLLPRAGTFGRVKSDFASAAQTAAKLDWLRMGLY
ncbi:MAG: YjbH domain-containing protein, partial [Burkholderiales bacterium]|nr:YjbH domain-containing protein [Burkholderiales bacterium]